MHLPPRPTLLSLFYLEPALFRDRQILLFHICITLAYQ